MGHHRLDVQELYEVGPRPIALALDLASSQFRETDGCNHVAGSHLDAVELVEHLAYLVDHYPSWSIEGGMGGGDPKGRELLTERLGDRVQLVGDDNLVTTPGRISDAITEGQGAAALIEPDRVGAVTETRQAVSRCYRGGFGAMVSHGSGETSDTFVADLAVAIEEPGLPYGRRPP